MVDTVMGLDGGIGSSFALGQMAKENAARKALEEQATAQDKADNRKWAQALLPSTVERTGEAPKPWLATGINNGLFPDEATGRVFYHALQNNLGQADEFKRLALEIKGRSAERAGTAKTQSDYIKASRLNETAMTDQFGKKNPSTWTSDQIDYFNQRQRDLNLEYSRPENEGLKSTPGYTGGLFGTKFGSRPTLTRPASSPPPTTGGTLEGQIAVNPKTGARMINQGGQWRLL